MDINHIDTYSPGTVINFQRSAGSVVLAKILGRSERGADCQSITVLEKACQAALKSLEVGQATQADPYPD